MLLVWFIDNGRGSTAAWREAFPKIIDLLKEKNIDDIRIIAGGIIPDEEIPKWNEIGIEAIFGPGSSTNEIIDYINGTKL